MNNFFVQLDINQTFIVKFRDIIGYKILKTEPGWLSQEAHKASDFRVVSLSSTVGVEITKTINKL